MIRPANWCIELTGRLVSLRPLSEAELGDRYVRWLNDPNVNQFLEVRHSLQTVDDARAYINAIRSRQGCEVFGVFLLSTCEHVGNIAITQFDVANGVATYGLMIGEPRMHRLGVGAEASLLLIEFLFAHAGVRRIHEGGIADNRPALQIVERLGFKLEGTLREAVVLTSGRLADYRVYGMLKSEWNEQRRKFQPLLQHVRIAWTGPK